MKIAIYGNVMQYQVDVSNVILDAESMIDSFKAVKQATCSLNGGVGFLQSAADDIDRRIQNEEDKKNSAIGIKSKSEEFLRLVQRIDENVAQIVKTNKEEFYSVNPWLKPSISVEEEEPWYEKTWNWLCDKGNEVVNSVKQTWNWIEDTVKKAWNGLVDFYEEHKKIIDTVLIVVGAVATIVAVVATGGVALVPLLGALGVSTTVATTISIAVAVVAVVSTVVSSTTNIIDVWCEIDDSKFQTFKKTVNVISMVSNITYSIGNIYNSVKGVSGKEYIARQKAIENGKQGYSNLDLEHSKMNHKSGAKFDQSRKKAIYEENIKRNNGVLRSDKTGKILDIPQKSAKGVVPSKYEAQVDHIFPREAGGANSFSNAQVIERNINIHKSNQLNFSDYFKYSRQDSVDYNNLFAWISQMIISNYSNLAYGGNNQ